MQYLVDSDWTIYYLHNRQDIVQKLKALRSHGIIGISIISLGEIYDGLIGASDREKAELDFQNFLSTIAEVVPLDEQTCRIFAVERRRLRESGQRIEDPDFYIGATAIRHNLTLLTNNRKHFERMYGLNIMSE